MSIKNKKEGLYIHIPFCESICSYCAFSKMFYVENIVDRYLQALQEELKKYHSYQFKSIYIGGGTPTSLNTSQLEFLFLLLKDYQSDDSFITIETNPSLSEEKILILEKYHVKRISIGVQTFNEEYQKLINRYTTYEEMVELINLLRKHHIDDINVDIIYGFNLQNEELLKKDLDLFTSLDVNHISSYCLQIEEGTFLYNQKYLPLDEEIAGELYQLLLNELENKGFKRYEVSNFAKENYQSKHNLIYWNNLEYGGVGLGASSYINNKRLTNTKSITKYLNHEYLDYEEILTKEDKMFYQVMLNLRLERGLSFKEYQELYQEDFYLKNQEIIEQLIEQKLLIIEDGYLKITRNNFFIMDFILRKLLLR